MFPCKRKLLEPVKIKRPLFFVSSKICCRYEKRCGALCISSKIAPRLYWPRKPLGSVIAYSSVSGFSKDTYGFFGNTLLHKVVLPLCLGPTTATLRKVFASFMSLISASRFIIYEIYIISDKSGIKFRICPKWASTSASGTGSLLSKE